MRIFRRLFGGRRRSRSDQVYGNAMNLGAELVSYMRQASLSDDPARAVMADIWSQRHNVPFMATVYEATQEMTAATDYTPGSKK
jgi:hypothetical protein